jgi:hypothetical protein
MKSTKRSFTSKLSCILFIGLLAIPIVGCRNGFLSPGPSTAPDSPAASLPPAPIPVVLDVSFQAFSDSATLTWSTDSVCACTVEYGTSPSCAQSAGTTTSSTSHAANLPGLDPDQLYYFRLTALPPEGRSANSWSDSFRTCLSSGALHAASTTDLGGGQFRYVYDWSSADQLLDWTPSMGAGLSLVAGSPPAARVLCGANEVGAMIWNRPIAAARVLASATATAASGHINIYTNLAAGWNGAPWCPNPAIGLVLRTSGAIWVVDGASYASSLGAISANVPYSINLAVGPGAIDGSLGAASDTRPGSYAPSDSGRVALGAYRGSAAQSDVLIDWGTVTIEGRPSAASLVRAPAIAGISAITDTVTTISWSTDIASSSLVEYGTDGKTFPSRVASSDLSLAHTLTVEGLEPGTQYWYRVSSRAPAGSTTTKPYSLVPGGGLQPDEIVFKATGSSFSAIVEVDAGATLLWTFADGSTSSQPRPSKDYQSAATRFNRLKVTPWSAIRAIDIGYDGGDGGSENGGLSTDPITGYGLDQQNVTTVYGMRNAAPSLRIWASSHNPLTALDFHDFASLHTMEAYYCQGVKSIDLRNTPSLRRLCLEDNDLAALDLSGCPNLEDLRGAANNYPSIAWGDTGAHVWHICVRENPQLTQNHVAFSRFPLLRELFIWNNSQSGDLTMSGTTNAAMVLLRAATNRYTSANLSGLFPAGRNGVIELNNNLLTSLDVSGNPGLATLDASTNRLDRDAVDAILATMDGYGTHGGTLNLAGNAAPSTTGSAHAANLRTNGWTVTVSP